MRCGCERVSSTRPYYRTVIVPLSYRYIPVEGDTVAALKIAAEIGRMVAKMHDAQVTSPTLNHSRVCSRVYDVLHSALCGKVPVASSVRDVAIQGLEHAVSLFFVPTDIGSMWLQYV